MKSLDNFTVYQKSISFLALASRILEALSHGNSTLSDQLRRSSLSISLNIAEGSGKLTPKDRRRYFATARGSALEAYAVVDARRVLGIVENVLVLEAKGILREVVSMLTALVKV